MQENTTQIQIEPNLRPNINTEQTKNNAKDSRLKYLKQICLSYININSNRNKLKALSEFVSTQVDFLAISKKEFDSSFPTAQFNLPGFRTLYRKYITGRFRGLLVYMSKDIPSRMIFIIGCPEDIQIATEKINLRKLNCSKIYTTLRVQKSRCVKSVRIRSYSGPHFPAFGLNTERYSLSLRIQSECEKMRTKITPNTHTFYAVLLYHIIEKHFG